MSETEKSNIDPKQAWESQNFKHDRQLMKCAFSPCGKFVFAGGTDRIVHRWELANEKKTELKGHASWIDALAFHPDGKHLISADYVGGIHCWVYADEQPKSVWSLVDAHQGSIRSISVSSDGNHFATAGHDEIVRVWSVSDQKIVHEFTGHSSPIFSLAFHPDGKNLVSAEQYGVIKHWDVTTGKHIRDFDASQFFTAASLSTGAQSLGIRSLTWDQTGETLACTGLTDVKDGDRRGGNSSVAHYDWKLGKQKQVLQAKGAGYVENALFHPAGYMIAACLTQEKGSIQFWKLDNPEPIHSMKSACRDFDLHPSGEQIAVSEWEIFGKAGNQPSTEKLEEYTCNRGVIRVFTLKEKPAEASKEEKKAG